MITAARSHIERRLADSAESAFTKGRSSGAPMSARTFWSLSAGRPAIAPAGVTRRAIDDEVQVPLHVGPPRNPGELSSDPCAIAGHEDAQHEQQVPFEGPPLH